MIVWRERRAARRTVLSAPAEHQAVVDRIGRVDHRQMRLAVRQPALDEVVRQCRKRAQNAASGRMPRRRMVIAWTWSGVARPRFDRRVSGAPARQDPARDRRGWRGIAARKSLRRGVGRTGAGDGDHAVGVDRRDRALLGRRCGSGGGAAGSSGAARVVGRPGRALGCR